RVGAVDQSVDNRVRCGQLKPRDGWRPVFVRPLCQSGIGGDPTFGRQRRGRTEQGWSEGATGTDRGTGPGEGSGDGTTPARGEGRGSSSVQPRGVGLNPSSIAGRDYCSPLPVPLAYSQRKYGAAESSMPVRTATLAGPLEVRARTPVLICWLT